MSLEKFSHWHEIQVALDTIFSVALARYVHLFVWHVSKLGTSMIFMKTSPILPHARSHLYLARPCPSHASFTALSSCPHLHGNSSLLGTNVRIPSQNYKYSQINCWSSFTCQRSLMAWVTGYCHIGSQWEAVPTQVQARRPCSEGGVGEAEPNWMKMWSSPGPMLLPIA